MLIDIMLPSGNTEKNALNRLGVDNDVAFATSAFLGRVFHGVCFGELGSGARIDICRQVLQCASCQRYRSESKTDHVAIGWPLVFASLLPDANRVRPNPRASVSRDAG